METLTAEPQPDIKDDQKDTPVLRGTKVLFVAEGPVPAETPAKSDTHGTQSLLPGTKVLYVDTSGSTEATKPTQEGEGGELAQKTPGTRAIYLGVPFGTNLSRIADMGTTQSAWMSQARNSRAATRQRRGTGVQIGMGGLKRDAAPRKV